MGRVQDRWLHQSRDLLEIDSNVGSQYHPWNSGACRCNLVLVATDMLGVMRSSGLSVYGNYPRQANHLNSSSRIEGLLDELQSKAEAAYSTNTVVIKNSWGKDW